MRSLPRPCRAGASAKPAHNSIVPAPPSNAISLGVHERPEHRGDAVRKAATGAIVDLMSRGKRELTGVLATWRLARLSKSVVSEVPISLSA